MAMMGLVSAWEKRENLLPISRSDLWDLDITLFLTAIILLKSSGNTATIIIGITKI